MRILVATAVMIALVGPTVAGPKPDKQALAAARAAKIKTPKIIARGSGFVVLTGKRDGAATVVAVTTPAAGAGTVIDLPTVLFDKTRAEITPRGPLFQIAVTSGWRKRLKKPPAGMHDPSIREEGSEGTWMHLLRMTPSPELACSFEGDFKHWGPHPANHQRKVEIKPAGDEALEVVITEWNRQREGQEEHATLHITLPATGTCEKTVAAAADEPPPVRADIAVVMRGATKRVGECARGTSETGTLKVKLAIDATGAVTELTVEPPHRGSQVGRCAMSVIGGLRFKPHGGPPLRITFPYVLNP